MGIDVGNNTGNDLPEEQGIKPERRLLQTPIT